VPAIVAPEGIASVAGHVDIGIAVTVIIGHGEALAIALGRQPGLGRDVLEAAIPQIAEQDIGGGGRRAGAEGSTLGEEEVGRPSPS
jgi:hypothetical protein